MRAPERANKRMSKYITRVYLDYTDAAGVSRTFQAFTPDGAEPGGVGYSGDNPEFGKGFVRVYCPAKSIVVPMSRVISIEVETTEAK